jgi:hypothetical protein
LHRGDDHPQRAVVQLQVAVVLQARLVHGQDAPDGLLLVQLEGSHPPGDQCGLTIDQGHHRLELTGHRGSQVVVEQLVEVAVRALTRSALDPFRAVLGEPSDLGHLLLEVPVDPLAQLGELHREGDRPGHDQTGDQEREHHGQHAGAHRPRTTGALALLPIGVAQRPPVLAR